MKTISFSAASRLFPQILALSVFALQSPAFGQNESPRSVVADLLPKLASPAADTQAVMWMDRVVRAYAMLGKPDSANIFLDRSWEISQKLGYPRGLVANLRSRGFLEFSAKHFDAARQKYRASLQKGAALNFHGIDCQILCDIARSWSRESRFDSALVAIRLAENAADNSDHLIDKANALAIHGSILANSGNRAKGIPYYNAAVKYAEAAGEWLFVMQYLGNLCNAFQEIGDLERMRAYAERMLDLSEKYPKQEQFGAAYIRLGSYFSEKKQWPEALAQFEKARPYLEGGTNNVELTNLYSNIADAYLHNGRLEESKSALEKLRPLAEKTNPAYAVPQMELVRAHLFMAGGQNAQTAETLQKARLLVEKNNNPELLELLWDAYTELYTKTGDFEKALAAKAKQQIFKDSVFNATLLRRALESEATAQFEKETAEKDREVELSRQARSQSDLRLALREQELLAQKLMADKQGFLVENLRNEGQIQSLRLSQKDDSLDRQRLNLQLEQADKAAQLAAAAEAKRADAQRRNSAIGILAALLLLATFLIFAFRVRSRERLRRAETERVRGIERLRAEITADIHDEMGANLTKIALTAQLAIQTAGAAPGFLHQNLESIGKDARLLNDQLGDLLFTINPQFDRFGEVQAYFREHANRFLEDTGLATVFDFKKSGADPVVPPEVKRQLFLIFKEALNNAVKYAHASTLRLTFSADETGGFLLEIADDGRGFEPTGARHFAQGIAGMRHRAGRIGADFELKSAPGEGTTVRVSGSLGQ